MKNNKFLLEDDGGGGGYGDMGGYGGFGMGGMGAGGNVVSDDILYKMFISGWVDLFKTAKSATKSITAGSLGLLKVSLNAVINSIIPWYKENYQKIFEDLHSTQDKIRKEHAPVYNNIIKSLLINDDFMVSAFFYDPSNFFNTSLTNPSTFVTAFGAAKGPGAIAELYDTFTGGGMLGKLIKQKVEKSSPGFNWESLKRRLENVLGTSAFNKIFGLASESTNKGTMLLFEADEEKTLSKDQQAIIKLLLSPDIIQAVLSSNEAKKMIAQQRQAVNAALEKLMKIVNELKRCRTPEQLERLTGKQITDVDKLSDEEKTKIVSETINTVVKMYSKMLSEELQHLLKVVPKSNKLVQAYATALKEIQK